MTARDRLSQTMRIDIPPNLRKTDSGHAAPAVGGEGKNADASRAHGPIGESSFQQLFQSVYDGAIVTDLRGRILDGNIRATEFFQYDRETLRQLGVPDVISGADEETIRTLNENLEHDRFILIQAHCRRRDGSFFPAEIAVNRLQINATAMFCFFVRDITLRRQAEEMLRAVHLAIRNAGTGIAITDLQGCITFANPAAGRLWAVEDERSMLGKDVRSLFMESERAEEMFLAVTAGQSWSGLMTLRRPDGVEVKAQVSADCNRDADDAVAGMVLSFVDIRDRIRAEEAELQAERQRVMVESLGAACHHLGQPATVILVSLEMLQRSHGKDPSVTRELLDACLESAESLRCMLHKLNEMTEYRTQAYPRGDEQADENQSRILMI